MIEYAIRYGSGEFLLYGRPNGGGVVFARSVLTTCLIYVPAVALKSYLAPEAVFAFDLHALASVIDDTLPWAGAIMAATYAAFYSRFSSQWSYLANLYNQLMAAQVQAPPSDNNRTYYIAWKAGFVEDAEDLHLATKPMYAAIILALLKDDRVRQKYIDDAPDGRERIVELEARLAKVLADNPVASLKSPDTAPSTI